MICSLNVLFINNLDPDPKLRLIRILIRIRKKRRKKNNFGSATLEITVVKEISQGHDSVYNYTPIIKNIPVIKDTTYPSTVHRGHQGLSITVLRSS